MRKELMPSERSIDTTAGGEIAEIIEKLVGEKFMCTCRHVIHIEESGFICYKHDGGLKDGEGQKWWLYIGCTGCNYDWSWTKVVQRVAFQKEDKL